MKTKAVIENDLRKLVLEVLHPKEIIILMAKIHLLECSISSEKVTE